MKHSRGNIRRVAQAVAPQFKCARFTRITVHSVMLAFLAFTLSACTGQTVNSKAPAKVEVRQEAGRWQLYRNQQPFFIKGAGGEGSLAKLKEAGGNSIRTWGTQRLQSVLDEAQKQGLTVCVGIWLHHEGDTEGFDYQKPEMLKQQLEDVRQTVLRFKDHPAVLMWGIGNEMEGYGDGDKPAIWKNVNDAAKVAKSLDPNHPVMTVVAEIGGKRIESINKYCPDVDIVGINTYAGAASIATRYAGLQPTKPYIITEFGPPGFWEVSKTSWGAPLEPTSPQKAEAYRRAYLGAIHQKPMCLGSYAFLWGNKQESTATWFGMFLPDGVKVNAVDTMIELWTGKSPQSTCPVIKELKAEGTTELKPNQTIKIQLAASGSEQGPLRVRWVVQPEQTKTLGAGKEESRLPEIQSAIIRSDEQGCVIAAPRDAGAYRVFAYVYNSAGASVGNIPFLVSASKQQALQDKPEGLPVAANKP
jgi:hypothetical protein